jgi:hypothetical protein
MGLGRIKHRFDRRRPRFHTPGSGIVLMVLALLVALLLTRGAGRPQRASQPSPSTSAIPQQESLMPMAAPTHPDATETAEAGCPRGCAEPPPGCDIKGNVSQRTGERIYHLPGQRYYGRTIIVPEDGEAWFCTEAEARASGWRKAKV